MTEDTVTANHMSIGEFCIGYVSTFILPYDFCRRESRRFSLRIDPDDLKRLRGEIVERIVPRDVDVNRLGRSCDCARTIDGERCAMCRCFSLDDHFLKNPDIDNKFYCERFLLHRIRIDHPRFPDTWASVVLVVYFNMNCACLLVNVDARHGGDGCGQEFSPDDCLLMREMLLARDAGRRVEWGEPRSRLWMCNASEAEARMNEFRAAYPVDRFEIDEGKPFPIKSFCEDYVEYLQRMFLYGFRFEDPLLNRLGIRIPSTAPRLLRWLGGRHFRLREVLKRPSVYNQYIVELKDVGMSSEGRQVACFTQPEECLENFPRQLYGILVGDEGWRFVPEEVAEKRLRNSWRSRRFVNISVYGHNILSINLKTGRYAADQAERMSFIGGWEAGFDIRSNPTVYYFAMRPCLAGLDHGILHAVCNAEVIYAEVNNSLQITTSSLRSSNIFSVIHRLSTKRNEAVQAMLSSYTGTQELDDLARLIYSQKGIDRAVDDLKYKVGLQGEMLTFLYQKKSNSGVELLTWLTILVSVVIGVYSINTEDGLMWKLVDKMPQGIRDMLYSMDPIDVSEEYLVVTICVIVVVWSACLLTISRRGRVRDSRKHR